MNLLTLINNMSTDSAKLAFRDVGSSAVFQEVTSIRNHLAKERAGTLNPESTDNSDDIADEQRGDESQAIALRDMGLQTKQSAYKRAQLMHYIRSDCASQLKCSGIVPSPIREDETREEYQERTLRFARWNYPQTPADALTFLCKTDGTVSAAIKASFERLIQKNLLTREEVAVELRQEMVRSAKRWSDAKEEVLVEISGLDEDEDHGEDAFAELEPWAGLRLYDATIKRMPRSLKRLIVSIMRGYTARDGIDPGEVESVVEIVNNDIEALQRGRKTYYMLHKDRIEADSPVFA